MKPTHAPDGHPSVEHGRIGVLLINLGTPDAPEAAAVRRYLAEFLSDKRVIEIPRLAWLPILHGIILRTRPKKSAHAYKQVWTEEGSPLAAITRRQTEALQRQLGDGVIVDFAMRYGNPGIGKSIGNLIALGDLLSLRTVAEDTPRSDRSASQSEDTGSPSSMNSATCCSWSSTSRGTWAWTRPMRWRLPMPSLRAVMPT